MTLVEFLNARLDEDEDLARVGDGYYWGRLLLNDRMRAEVEAKRRIIAERQRCGVDPAEQFWVPGLAMTLALLALPYADHPDYDEAWRP